MHPLEREMRARWSTHVRRPGVAARLCLALDQGNYDEVFEREWNKAQRGLDVQAIYARWNGRGSADDGQGGQPDGEPSELDLAEGANKLREHEERGAREGVEKPQPASLDAIADGAYQRWNGAGRA
jgi:hypothetical protein